MSVKTFTKLTLCIYRITEQETGCWKMKRGRRLSVIRHRASRRWYGCGC